MAAENLPPLFWGIYYRNYRNYRKNCGVWEELRKGGKVGKRRKSWEKEEKLIFLGNVGIFGKYGSLLQILDYELWTLNYELKDSR